MLTFPSISEIPLKLIEGCTEGITTRLHSARSLRGFVGLYFIVIFALFSLCSRSLAIIHTYDDHEIVNNFAGQSNDSTQPFPNADDAFSVYNAAANYDSPVSAAPETAVDEDAHYFHFRHGDVAFFVMDTRRYRSDVTQTNDHLSMLGEAQLASLHRWLEEVIRYLKYLSNLLADIFCRSILLPHSSSLSPLYHSHLYGPMTRR
jgi:hypothetical protein